MNFKKVLMAAAAALCVAGLSAASAHPAHGGYGYHGGFGFHAPRGVIAHRIVFETLRMHRIRYAGDPFFMSGHYVVRTFDRFGRVRFVEIDPYSGMLVGYFRL